MKRNKYLNTFDNTADYENYIESAYPGFPNVGLTKDDGELHYIRTSPNDHVLYGELVDATQPLPTISLNNTTNTATLDALTNMFYLDSWSNAAPTSISFNNEWNIKSIKKLKGFNTSKVTDIHQMFQSCSKLTQLDLSSFDTSKVTNMNSMFYGCESLKSLDLSSFDTSNVTDMHYMFYGCESLKSLDLSSFDTSNVTSTWNMFYHCSSLKDVYITAASTLNALTNNLNSCDNDYIPKTATIHYNGVDYKWTDSAWAQQN